MSSTKEALSFSSGYEPSVLRVRGNLAALSVRFAFLQELQSTDKTRNFLANDLTKDRTRLLIVRVLSADVVDEPSQLLSFLVEAQAAASLSHKNIVASTKPEQVEGIHFYVSHYPEGARSLRDLLEQKGWLEVEPFLKIASQIAYALHYAHQAEVLHLKLQPENVLIDKNHNVSLTGFGIPSRPARQWLYQRRSQECPLAYRSPEQLENKHLDERSDLYTLGILLYEMLTDMLPFNAQDETRLRQKIAIHKAPVLHLIRPEIPESLSAIVAKLIAANPTERFQDAAELRSALARLADRLSQEAMVQRELGATAREPSNENSSQPPSYHFEENHESLSYNFEEETDPLSLEFTDAEEVQNVDHWPSKKLNPDHMSLVKTKPQAISELPALANQQNQIDTIPSQLLAEDIRENTQVRATGKSRHRKFLLFVVLAIGIAILTEIFVLAYAGHLKRLFNRETGVSGSTLSTPSTVSDINSRSASDPSLQGDPEDRAATAEQPPVAAQGTSEAPVTDANHQAIDSKATDTGAAPEHGQPAVDKTLPAPARVKPDTSRLRQQLRITNKRKAENQKTRKSVSKAKPVKAKPRRGFFRWRPW